MNREFPFGSNRGGCERERGVSEMVGFVLSFSMILLMVGILFTSGFSTLNDYQSRQQTENAEQVFLAVADGFGELQEGQAPKRAGSLDLDVGASLTIRDTADITVAVHGPGFQETYDTRSLEYRYQGTTIAYENGAVLRGQEAGSVMVGTPPDIHCSNDTNVAYVSVVELVSVSNTSVGGGTVTITGVKQSTELRYPQSRTAPSIDNVTVEVDSRYVEAWNQRFGSSDTNWVETDPGIFACESVTRAYVRHTIVEVRIVH